jgi:hypothetical protein
VSVSEVVPVNPPPGPNMEGQLNLEADILVSQSIADSYEAFAAHLQQALDLIHRTCREWPRI